jgi:hypothetical protein
VIAPIGDVSTIVVSDQVPNATLKPYGKFGITIVRAVTYE